ncbi:MAG: AAA family ATPase, partial [Halobacteriota archaeon]|nr:AAA family ATPase [Halobacteriota archaeon]
MSEDVSTEKWEEFLGKYYKDKVLELASEYPEKRSLVINWSDVDRYDSELADALLENPDITLERAEEALRNFDLPTGIVLEKAHVRISKLPMRGEIRGLR